MYRFDHGPLDIANYVQQQGEMGAQKGKQSRLARLYAQGIEAPDQRQPLLADIARTVSPQDAQAAENGWQGSEEVRYQQLGRMASLLTSAPPGMRPQLYKSMVPELTRLGLQAPPDYTPEIDPLAERLAQVYGGVGAGASGVQSTYVDASGNRVAIMRDGSTQILGQNDPGMSAQTIEVVGADGRTRRMTFNKRTGQYEEAQFGGGMPASLPAQAPAQPAQDVTAAIAEQANRMLRSGVPEAQVDAWAMQQGQQFRPAGMQMQSGGLPPQQPTMPAPQQPGAFVSRTPEEEAAAKKAAELQAELAFAPQRAAADAQREGAVVRAREDAEAAAKKSQVAEQVMTKSDQTIALIDRALNHPGRAAATGLSGTIDPRNYTPGTDARDFQVVLDQLKGQTFLEAFQSLKGGGAITQVEGQKAEQAIARLDRAQSDQAFIEALRELRGIAEAAKQRAARNAPEQAQPATGGWSIRRAGQ